MPTLVKRTLHSSIAESIFREIGTRGSKLFFFLGKPTGWDNPTSPIDSIDYEMQTRSDIVLLQEIKPSDACLVVPRIDWKYGETYDMYDDTLCDELAGINLTYGGYGYVTTPTVVISGGGPNAQGATAIATIDDQGRVIDVTLTNKGSGYIEVPTITFVGTLINQYGSNVNYVATAEGVINSSYSGATRIEDSLFYVLTEDDNVYKCLSNNNNSPSTFKPTTESPYAITTQDGYVWKYMYTIPITLKNKFLTAEYMPVVNELNDKFHDNGQIGEVALISGGKNYTWASLSVSGDGFNKENPFMIRDASITSIGKDYIDPHLSIQSPWTSDFIWAPNFEVVTGEIITYTTDLGIELFYKALISGILGDTAPIHRSGTERNGTTILQYVGETARAVVSQVDGSLSSVNLIGRVYSIDLVTGGSGYTSAPIITIQGEGSGATATSSIFYGTVSSIKVVTMGDNYINLPTVIVGNQWTANGQFTAGDQIFFGNNLYTVLNTGVVGTTGPTHISGTLQNGNVQLQYAGKAAKATSKLIYGYGYSSTPLCEIIDSIGYNGNIEISAEKSSARISPLLRNGSIVGVTIDDAGIGYTYATINVNGDGSGAILRSSFFVGDVNTPHGNSQLIGPSGSIHHIKVLSGGYDYSDSSVPTITIEGDGYDAKGIAVLDTDNGADSVNRIDVVNPGYGYSWANVTISGGTGIGVKAKAIISPYLGHGKDAVSELFANRIMFYTVLSGESLFGFNITNEYRQVGIIKNPRNFEDKSYLVSGTHTPCVIVSGKFDASKFSDDMEIRNIATDKKYRIVSIFNNTMLLQNLQNDILVLGSELGNNLSGTELSKFTVDDVINPTVDKYSGDLLYIENRPPFKPTNSESIALRSVLTF